MASTSHGHIGVLSPIISEVQATVRNQTGTHYTWNIQQGSSQVVVREINQSVTFAVDISDIMLQQMWISTGNIRIADTFDINYPMVITGISEQYIEFANNRVDDVHVESTPGSYSCIAYVTIFVGKVGIRPSGGGSVASIRIGPYAKNLDVFVEVTKQQPAHLAKPIRRGWVKATVGAEIVDNKLMPIYANKRIIKGWIGDENNHPQLILRSTLKNWTPSMDLKPEGLTFTPERKNICGYNDTLYGVETSLGKVWKRVNDEFIPVMTYFRLESIKCLSIVYDDKLYFIAQNYGHFDILEYSEPEGVPTIEFKAQYSEDYPNNFELFDVYIYDNKLYILVWDFRFTNDVVVFLIWDPATTEPGPYTIYKGPQFDIPRTTPSPNFNYGVMYRGNIHFISPYAVNYPNYDFAHHVMDIKHGTIQEIPKEYSPYATGWGDPTLFVINDEIHALTSGNGHSYWDGFVWHADDPSPIQGSQGVSCVTKTEVHLFEPGTKSHYISTDNIFN